jgi:hypothetical protein
LVPELGGRDAEGAHLGAGIEHCQQGDEVPAVKSWRIKLNTDETVDEVVMFTAYVHLEDLGDAYMLIVDNGEQHIHLTIPSKRRKAFVYEQFDPSAQVES